MNKFSKIVANELKYYVYLYLHPTTREVFYVGKGKGDRVFNHLHEESESEKVRLIQELKSVGLNPEIEILIHGIEDELTALRIEAAVIDLLGVHKLTNQQSGWKSATYGRMTIQQLIATYAKVPTSIEEPCVLIRISQLFRYSMSEIELYDYTRGYWKLNRERAAAAQYAFAVYEGIIQEVYSILQWVEAGSTLNTRTDHYPVHGRFEFVGNLAPNEIRNKYKYKSVEHFFQKGNINPILYVNC
ncbi:MAG: hypothetical protein IPH94_08585 [Saprospiraceae bacterium]|nr:hypothetical protein [Saprospiraceae bacterium]MBK8851744.1 hypothetical protein [Saprospiraceae bacterium]MBL0084544.1 hypothetical protein [Saprospiraceae bacterium]